MIMLLAITACYVYQAMELGGHIASMPAPTAVVAISSLRNRDIQILNPFIGISRTRKKDVQ